MVSVAPWLRGSADRRRSAPAAAFSIRDARPRACGRMGGVVGDGPDPPERDRLERLLGPGARLLGPRPGVGPRLVADADLAHLDGVPLADLDDAAIGGLGERLAEIEGAFAVAWWDDAGAVRLARDAIGERSLFYAASARRFAFASSLPPLLHAGCAGAGLDPVAIASYLSCAYVPGRRTLLADVRELLPGESLRLLNGAPDTHRYFDLAAESDAETDETALTRELRGALEQAVAVRLPDPHEPMGALLSGGLDSSLVLALAVRRQRAPVTVYSIAFGAGHADELEWSGLVARHCGVEQRVVELSADAVVSHLDATMSVLNDPIGDPLTVPNALLFREAARDCRAVLNGEGGDPCFGGPKNLPMLLAELYGDGAPGGREAAYLRAHQRCYDDLPRLLEPGLRDALADAPLEAELCPLLSDARYPRFVSRLMAANVILKGPHHILQKVDCQSFPFGVVPRSPLFDRRVVELAFRIPPQLKLRGAVEKYLLKRAVADLLPDAVLERPKSGMLVPVEAWFRGPLRPLARERLLDGLAGRGLLRPPALRDLLDGRLGAGPRRRRGVKIWLLVALEAWLSSVVDARPSSA